MNDKLINLLKSLVEQIKENPKKEKNDFFRIKSIENAINIILNIPEKITSIDMLQNTPGIGKGILARIQEILDTGKLEEVIHHTPLKLIKLQEAIGDVSARNLYKKGIKSLEELNNAVKKGEIEVTHRIELILKYTFGKVKLKENIPRSEMIKIDSALKRHIQKYNPKLEYLICGSYRREKSTSNDIDMIIIHPENKKILPEFINYLIKKGFLIDHLTNNISKLKTKYMGFCISTQNNIVRRIDIRLIESKSKYAAMLYFTGPRDFNTRMRNIAKKLGYKLNEYYIENIKKKEKIYPKSEQEVFNILNLNYVPPPLRN